MNAPTLTPVQQIEGLHVKREDLHKMENGVNGAKLRAAQYLIGMSGASWVVSAASLLSPQNPMAATVAADYGMQCTIIVGGTNPVSAAKYTTTQLATEAGAVVAYAKAGYNPNLKAKAREEIGMLEDLGEDVYWLQYGITTPDDADDQQIYDFHRTSADQVQNIPPSVSRIHLPWGSANTGVGVLMGLDEIGYDGDIDLYVIGPDRMPWAQKRLEALDCPKILDRCFVHQLHPDFATYGDKMKANLGDVVLHPTYEGKVASYLDLIDDSWRHEERSLFWIVGGPLPKRKGAWG